jgi:dipeptidyl aminopeptidase/acylaminoacyl peptidase
MLITLIQLVGCLMPQATDASLIPSARVEPGKSSPSTPTFTLIPLTSSPTATATPAPTITATATISSTPDPYEEYTVDYLTKRDFGGGSLEIEDVIADNSYFTRYLITFPSDGLTIYGFMNVPKRIDPPYPVVIALHGYIDPAIYTTLDYTTGYADAIARAGFLVIHPNLRNYPPSDNGDNLFRVGMAEDVLNLINIIEAQAGQTGSLEKANPNSIGIWGHSMGGGVSLRVITVSPKIKAAVLYGAMSGDEQRNFEAIFRWSGGERGIDELAVPDEELINISPINYLERISAQVSIHHGESDTLVPIQWSQELCDELTSIGKKVECFTYPGQPHTFNGDGEMLFNQRVADFFIRTLSQR